MNTTTKEKVINESIKRVQVKIDRLQAIYDANPYSELIEIRIEAQKLLVESQIGGQIVSKKLLDKISKLAEREKAQQKLIKQQRDFMKLLDKLGNLKSELYFLQRELQQVENDKIINDLHNKWIRAQMNGVLIPIE